MSKPTRFVLLFFFLLGAPACGGSDDSSSEDVLNPRDDATGTDAGADADADADAHAEVPGDDVAADAPYDASDSPADESPPETGDTAADGDGSGSVCGGIAGFRCPPGETCDIRACWPDATGICVPDPDTCSDLRAPVCGCDGLTYGNDCERVDAGAALDHEGECETPASCKPDCRTGADGRLGWFIPCPTASFCPVDCTGCSAECQAIGTRSEGWYAVCTEPGRTAGCPTSGGMASLIVWDTTCAP